MTISKKEIDKLIDDPMMKLVMDGLQRYDSRYIGNVSEKEARKMFPEMFND